MDITTPYIPEEGVVSERHLKDVILNAEAEYSRTAALPGRHEWKRDCLFAQLMLPLPTQVAKRYEE